MTVRVTVVDANVLYSIEVTDLLLTLATHRLVRVHWSDTILDEVRRNLALRPDLSEAAIDYRIDRMNLALHGSGGGVRGATRSCPHRRRGRPRSGCGGAQRSVD